MVTRKCRERTKRGRLPAWCQRSVCRPTRPGDFDERHDYFTRTGQPGSRSIVPLPF